MGYDAILGSDDLLAGRPVRLHKGSIAGRLLDEGDLVIERTKYFDFTGPSCWQGLRQFPADTSAKSTG